MKKKTVRTKKKVPNARVSGKKPKTSSPGKDKQRWVEGIIMILLGVYFYYAFVTAQPSIIDRIVGKYILMYLFGNGVPVLCLILIGSGILLMLDKLEDYKTTIAYIVLLAFNYMVLLSIYIPNLNLNYKVIDLFQLASYGGYGGIVGILIAYILNTVITRTGTLLFILALTVVEIGLILKANYPNVFAHLMDSNFGIIPLKDKISDLRDDYKQKQAIKEEKLRREYSDYETNELNIDDEDITDYQVDDSLGLMQRDGTDFEVETTLLDFQDQLQDLSLDNDPTPKKESTPFDVEDPVGSSKKKDNLDFYMFGEQFTQDDLEDLDNLSETDSSEYLVQELTDVEVLDSGDEPVRKVVYNYPYPSFELLTKPSISNQVDEKEIKNNALRIKETLNNFGVDATIRNYERGPSITRFEVKPAPGVKVSKIVNLNDDLALALATSDIRIEAPIPGKDAIGIEVPNKKSDIVHLREILDSNEFINTKASLPFSVGKTLSGHNIIGDISSMPHMLIAGSTGSGKSVCLNSIIISLLFKESPEDLKMIMIDPKMVELNQYNSIPHLLIPVVTDPQKAAGALNWGIEEMESRYNLFSETGVRDLETYNDLMIQNNEETLPRIIIIIDELADLMMTSPKEVENAICRIAQKARACGIHLLIATQRPSVDVITGLIKSNIPSRIAFAVASNTDSRTILDSAGAEKLLGKGDMLYKPVGLSKPLRVQCSYVSDAEITRVINSIKTDEEPEYNEQINETISQHLEEKKKKEKDEKKDKLFDEAVEVAFNNNQISTSMLQRRLGIGYARAGRIIDSMEKDGIISGPNGSKPRKLLITPAEYRNMI